MIPVSTRNASSAFMVTTAGGSGSGSTRQPTAYKATPSASFSSMTPSLSRVDQGWIA